MTTKRKVYYKPDGQVIIIIPVEKSRMGGESEQDWLDRVYAKTETQANKVLAQVSFDLLVEQQKPFPDIVEVARLQSIVTQAQENNLQDLDKEDKLVSDFPLNYNSTNRHKLRGGLGQPLIIDDTVITDIELKAAMELDLDTELAKASPSSNRVMRMQRKLQKKDYTPEP